MDIKPFKGYRQRKKELVEEIASPPYDVISSSEAREEVKQHPLSFLHVVKPEVDLPEDIDTHSEEVYKKGKENLHKMIEWGMFAQDETESYYIYAQTMNDRIQYGIMGCANVDDYMHDVIKKHELTRPDKEEDRMQHVRVTNFNAEPVFFAYKDNDELEKIVQGIVKNDPEYDFTSTDGVRHQMWVVSENDKVFKIREIFEYEITCTYVADGHHRTAAAALVGREKRKQNPDHTGTEEYNYFLAVHFPASQLTIIDYNRVVKDLNGLSAAEFIKKLEKSFVVEKKGAKVYKPSKLHEFSMYLEGIWYAMEAKDGTYDDKDPIGVLDVTILTEHVLKPHLNIVDLRRDNRIEFVGGIRGLGELKKRVDNGEMKAAFALFPVSMEQLMNIADSGEIMPPKTTWFEPKLRSGLVIHSLDD